jgi:hypothetical protein
MRAEGDDEPQVCRVSGRRRVCQRHLGPFSHLGHLAQLMVAHSAPGGYVVAGCRVGRQHDDQAPSRRVPGGGREADHRLRAPQPTGVDLYLRHRSDAPR